MRTSLRIALLLTLAMWGTAAVSARSPRPVDRLTLAAAADDNMTPYRKLATDTLEAFKAHDLTTARRDGKALETAWDKNEKALQKSSPEVWKQIDKAMDDFIKPLQAKAPDANKVQTTYDAFIAKLKLAVKGDAD
jgi:type II secretory pathway component PulJ